MQTPGITFTVCALAACASLSACGRASAPSPTASSVSPLSTPEEQSQDVQPMPRVDRAAEPVSNPDVKLTRLYGSYRRVLEQANRKDNPGPGVAPVDAAVFAQLCETIGRGESPRGSVNDATAQFLARKEVRAQCAEVVRLGHEAAERRAPPTER